MSSEISGRPAVKIPIWLWLLAKSGRRRVGVLSGPDSCRSSVGPGLGGHSPRLAKATRQGRAWETTALELDKASEQVCWGYEALECEQWSPDTFLLSRYCIPPAQAKRRAPAPAVDSDQWTLTSGL